MCENYIVINGKKAELTEEQLKQLGIEVEKKRNNPFDKGLADEYYWFIDSVGGIEADCRGCGAASMRYSAANFFNDRDFAKQVALHQQLYRKLLKYAYDNNAEVTEEDWERNIFDKYLIYYHHELHQFDIDCVGYSQFSGAVHFANEAAAEGAIKDVIEPFMKEHPEFVW